MEGGDSSDFVRSIYEGGLKSPSRQQQPAAEPQPQPFKVEGKTKVYTEIPDGYELGEEIVEAAKPRRPAFLSKNWFWFVAAGVGALGVAAAVIAIRFRMIGKDPEEASRDDIQVLNKARQQAVLIGLVVGGGVAALTLIVSKLVFKWQLRESSG